MMTPGGRKYKTNYNSENGEEVEMLEIPTKYLLINIETTIVFFFGQTTIVNNQNIFYHV